MDKPKERPQNKNLKRDAGPGRPVGSRSFSTLFKLAIKKLAEQKKLDPADLEESLIMTAIAKAKKGDHRFYKDLMDRMHGTPIQRHAGADGDGPIEHRVIHVPQRNDK